MNCMLKLLEWMLLVQTKVGASLEISARGFCGSIVMVIGNYLIKKHHELIPHYVINN